VPDLKPVTVEPKTTALLILDIMKVNCSSARPRCVATIPNIKALLDQARAHHMMVFYTLVGPGSPTPADQADPSLTAKKGEWVVRPGPDKFLGSNLERRLKAHGIKTVIVTGSSAQGAVLGTSSHAAQVGYQVIVPDDGMSSDEAYDEQYTAWHLAKAAPASVLKNITLTRSDLIKFGG
jgi:nicotinamidase-related amidase